MKLPFEIQAKKVVWKFRHHARATWLLAHQAELDLPTIRRIIEAQPFWHQIPKMDT